MLWDHRPGRNRFAGIVLQEYSAAERRLIGSRQVIFEGTAIGFTEAPHLYKRDGFYYLLTAEGGTGWGHAVTMARSRSLTGPYELHPDTYILTARDRPDVALAARRSRRSGGHAARRDAHRLSLRAADSTIAAAARWAARRRCSRCVGIRRLAADHGWTGPADVGGRGAEPARARFPTCASARATSTARSCRSSFSGCARRGPTSCSASRRGPATCGLYGRETMGSLFRQALVARRQQSHCYSAATVVDFEPEHFQQMAGLVCYYNGIEVPLPPRLARRARSAGTCA